MATYTDDFGLIKLGPGEDESTDNRKHVDADVETVARLLRLGAETHRHNGAAAATTGTEVGARSLSLVAQTDEGGIPAGVRVYYKFTLVDSNGLESSPSATAIYVDTPAQVASPGAPTAVVATTGGTLLPGNYYYVLSAYTGTNTYETKALSPLYVSIPAGTITNKVTLTLPALPSGATGFNIYRKKPGGVRYDYLTSTTGSSLVDDNSIAEDCNRTLPTANYTNMQNNVDVTLTGDALPSGTTWKLYRTYVENDYTNSMIAHVTTGTTYEDLGAAGTASLPVLPVDVGSPSRILLTDGAEVQGSLPPNMVAYKVVVDMDEFTGALSVRNGSRVWRNQYDIFLVQGCVAHLGKSSVPAATDVIVDVNKYSQSATPGWSTIFTTQANRPKVLVGSSFGLPAVPDVTVLYKDDALCVDVDQAGGGATPTDRDLVVQVVGWGFVNQSVSVDFP